MMPISAQRNTEPARRDWSARARSSAIDALRYTKFVSWMRRGLSLGAFAIIFAVLAFFFIQRQPKQLAMSYEKIGHIENDLAMLKPRLTGNDSKGNPFVITADAAIQDPKDSKRARLKNIEADVAADNNGWINARAKQGNINMGAGKLELSGGIDLFSDSGYELHTESASVDLSEGSVRGQREVRGNGPFGTIRADSFWADREKGQILLVGNVRMVLDGAKK